MYRSLAAGRRVTLDQVGIFADGVAVREVGALTFALAQQTVDEIVRVTNDEICAAIKDIFDDTRSDHGAGRRAGGGRPEDLGRVPRGRRPALAAVLSGANMNFDRLRFVAERAELGEAREALFAVTIPERPGAFREFCARDRPPRGDRVQLPPGRAPRGAHLRRRRDPVAGGRDAGLPPQLNAAGYETADLSENEMAKLHVRHMVGGRASDARHERLVPLRVPRAAGRAHAVPRRAGRPLEHQPVPLPESRRRLRPRARRLRGAGRPARRRSARSSTGSATHTWRSSRTTRIGCSSTSRGFIDD